MQKELSDHFLRMAGALPLHPSKGSRPFANPRLASEATRHDAWLGIELAFRIFCGRKIIQTRPNEGPTGHLVATLVRAERWVFLGRAPLRTLPAGLGGSALQIQVALFKIFERGSRGSAPQMQKELSDHFLMMAGALPLHPSKGSRPFANPRLASEATGLDASLGIELVLRIVCERKIIQTRPNEGPTGHLVATLVRAERWVFWGRAPLRTLPAGLGGSAPQMQKELNDHFLRMAGALPLHPSKGSRPFANPRLASEATGLDAWLGIELVLRIVCERKIIQTRPNEAQQDIL